MSYIPKRELIFRRSDGLGKLQIFLHSDGYYQLEISDYNGHFTGSYNINPIEMETFITQIQMDLPKRLMAWNDKNKK